MFPKESREWAPPHAEEQVEVGVLADVEEVVGGEPHLALGVVEGKEAVAQRRDPCNGNGASVRHSRENKPLKG